MAFDPKLVRVVLLWRPPVEVIDIQGDISSPNNHQTPDITYLAYGSSITHGNNSISPTGMFAHRTATALGVDLINLGLGGGAHCESVS